VTKGEGHSVTLKVEAGPEDLEHIIEETYRDLSRKVKVAGFRSGKVPRKIIDTHIGVENVRREAIQKGLPTLYLLGVIESGISPVSDPRIEILETGDDASVVFEATIDVKPEIEVKDYKGLEIDKPETEVTDEDVAEALDEARDRFATLEVVDGRPVSEGDFVLFDYKVFTDGVPVEGSSGTDRLVEVGSNDFLLDFDKQLIGARKGDILDVVVTYPAEYEVRELAGKPATYRTMVKEIKTKILPPLDDGLAKEISSFETLDEFKADLEKRIARIKEITAERQVRERAITALIDRTYIDLPESMVEHQIEHEIEDLSEELGRRGITLEDYLSALKGSRYQLEKAIRDRVVESLKAELALEAVADAESIEITDEEAEEYIRENAATAGADPEKVVEDARLHMRIPAIKANLRLSRAADLLAENATFRGMPAGGPEAVSGATASTEEMVEQAVLEVAGESEALTGETGAAVESLIIGESTPEVGEDLAAEVEQPATTVEPAEDTSKEPERE